MSLTPYQKDVYAGKICPYCKSETSPHTETFVYGKEYRGRMVICCKNYPNCDAYVGTHENGEALGRLAKKELRQVRNATHKAFDVIWVNNKYCDRDTAYEWLSDQLGVPLEYTHIGMFNEETCRKAIKLCSGVSEKDFK